MRVSTNVAHQLPRHVEVLYLSYATMIAGHLYAKQIKARLVMVKLQGRGTKSCLMLHLAHPNSDLHLGTISLDRFPACSLDDIASMDFSTIIPYYHAMTSMIV